MTEKRFTIKPSKIADGFVIIDNENKYTFPILESTLNYMFCKALNELAEENEQLKSTMKEVAELLEEEVDLFSDKATEYDICAYVELQELDNKDAYYMATSTKKAIKMLKEL